MAKYELVTKYIHLFENGDFGEWFIDKENDGSMEHPIQMPYVMYFKTIDDFIDDVHRFVDLHEDMVKIERIVPMYPFSKDCAAYERMIKILSLYRLTLGQARQEELLEYIFQNCEAGEDFKGLFINLSPHYKEKKQGD